MVRQEPTPAKSRADSMRARRIALDHAKDGYLQECEEAIFDALEDVRAEAAGRSEELVSQLGADQKYAMECNARAEKVEGRLAEVQATLANCLSLVARAREYDAGRASAEGKEEG